LEDVFRSEQGVVIWVHKEAGKPGAVHFFQAASCNLAQDQLDQLLNLTEFLGFPTSSTIFMSGIPAKLSIVIVWCSMVRRYMLRGEKPFDHVHLGKD
jgi:hypothetical protein